MPTTAVLPVVSMGSVDRNGSHHRATAATAATGATATTATAAMAAVLLAASACVNLNKYEYFERFKLPFQCGIIYYFSI